MLRFLSSLLWKPREEALSIESAYDIVEQAEQQPPEGGPSTQATEDEVCGDYDIITRTGTITAIDEGVYVIDGKYEFTSDLEGLGVGTKVSYQICRRERRLEVANMQVVENDWDVQFVQGRSQWCTRTLVCAVESRSGRRLVLTPGEIEVDLDKVGELRVNDSKVASEFVPMEGDWVQLEARCEVDEHVLDLAGKVVDVLKLRPLRVQYNVGRITKWDEATQTGAIDRKVYFSGVALYGGYIPALGDQVVAEMIESTQGLCTWRALKIHPDYLQSRRTRRQQLMMMTEEEKSREVEPPAEVASEAPPPDVHVKDNVQVRFKKLGDTKRFSVEVSNNSDAKVVLVDVVCPKTNGQVGWVGSSGGRRVIRDGQMFSVEMTCTAKVIGKSSEMVFLNFETFKVARWITILVESVAPANPGRWNPKPRRYNNNEDDQRNLVRGRKVQYGSRFVRLQMPSYAIPQKLLDLASKYHPRSSEEMRAELEAMRPVFRQPLAFMVYEDKFHSLIYLEETATVLAMRDYDMEHACFVRSGEFLLLGIDNLAERRPSVIAGDKVIARNLHVPSSPDYEGVVHNVGRNHVYLKFAQVFHDTYDNEDYSVSLQATRTTFKREHYAITLAIRYLGKDILFPSQLVEKPPQLSFYYRDRLDETSCAEREDLTPAGDPDEPMVLEWRNKLLNTWQRRAVVNILLGTCRPLPYIVFGPPGTGKTITLVEAILQILKLLPNARLLVAAPSNSAADLLALRLIASKAIVPGDLIRLVSRTASAKVSAELAPYCATVTCDREGTEANEPVVTDSGLVLGCSSAVVGRHRITVCTCSTAGVLHNLGFSKGHFSHIVIDEAGQTSEPSVMIPLSFLDTETGQAVLAGDPMQLGPVILSTMAATLGLEESYLERVINRFPYVRDPEGHPDTYGYDPRLITKLLYNYRSLPRLLKLPSSLFYHDELIPTLSEEDSPEAKMLSRLEAAFMFDKSKDVRSIPPILFHGVMGENYQTEDSPSWYNSNEAAQVFFYANELFRLGFVASDIGIITPYKAQAKTLTLLFQEAEFDVPKIGTVEDFQGQEYNVILLSTVRSSKSRLADDRHFNMGFVANPRRLNVSITRAKVFLLIVGNPALLSTDHHWLAVLKYCVAIGGYVGCPFTM